MKKIKILMVFAVATLSVYSCKKSEAKSNATGSETVDSTAAPTDSTTMAAQLPSGDNSQTSLDWEGTYEATLPCADCSGIKTTLVLNKDNTYTMQQEYLDKKTKTDDKGSFTWSKDGSMITIEGKDGKHQYKVGENQLIQLDQEGKEITGALKDLYIFKKK